MVDSATRLVEALAPVADNDDLWRWLAAGTQAFARAPDKEMTAQLRSLTGIPWAEWLLKGGLRDNDAASGATECELGIAALICGNVDVSPDARGQVRDIVARLREAIEEHGGGPEWDMSTMAGRSAARRQQGALSTVIAEAARVALRAAFTHAISSIMTLAAGRIEVLDVPPALAALAASTVTTAVSAACAVVVGRVLPEPAVVRDAPADWMAADHLLRRLLAGDSFRQTLADPAAHAQELIDVRAAAFGVAFESRDVNSIGIFEIAAPLASDLTVMSIDPDRVDPELARRLTDRAQQYCEMHFGLHIMDPDTARRAKGEDHGQEHVRRQEHGHGITPW
jgi:hypothetical protein